MPITTNPIKITIRYEYLGEQCENVGWYFGGGAAFVTATMLQVLEAYWNDVKAAWHALAYNSLGINSINSILGETIGGSLEFAEFAIPEDERVGDKTTGTAGSALPGTLAGAVRLTVGTRVTRPGQKRAPFIGEEEIVGNDLEAAYLTQLSDWGETWSQTRTLGAPAATAVLVPNVVSIDRSTGDILARQDVTGQIINPYASSQVSRKRGHGS